MNRPVQLALYGVGGAIGIGVLIWALVPLGALIPSTAAMLQTTKAIRQETIGLERSVAQVEVQLAGLVEQEALLKQQGDLIGQSLTLLQQQEANAKEATLHLRKLAALEETTVRLTTQADQAATSTAEVLRANKGALDQLATATGRIEEGSVRMERQVDLLLGEMAKTEKNFAPIKRWKNNLSEAKRSFTGWLQGVGEWIGSWFR